MKKLLTILTLFAIMVGTAACVKSQSLESTLKEVNRQCPVTIDGGVTMTRAYDDGRYIVYEYRIDESLIGMDILAYKKYDMKQDITRELRSQKMKDVINLCNRFNKGLSYRYIGDTSGRSVVIDITLQELRGAM